MIAIYVWFIFGVIIGAIISVGLYILGIFIHDLIRDIFKRKPKPSKIKVLYVENIQSNGKPVFVAWFADNPGIMSQSNSLSGLTNELKDAAKMFIEMDLESLKQKEPFQYIKTDHESAGVGEKH